MDVAAFYNTYGAYLTSSVVIGGMLSSSISTSQTSNYTDTAMGAAATAAYNEGISSAKVETEYTYTDSKSSTQYTCTEGIQVVGGDVTNIHDFNIDEWEATISDNPAVVGYGDGLYPMYKLVTDDPQRQTDLINGLAAYFSQPNPYILAPLSIQTFTQTATAGTGPENVSVVVPPGYKILGGGASLLKQDNNNQFLTGANVLADSPPTQWSSGGKSVHTTTNATLTSYAIAVYDPDNLLDVKVFYGISGSSGTPSLSKAVDSGYVLTGGGVSTNPSNSYGLMLIASAPSNSDSTVSTNTWYGYAAQHLDDCAGSVEVHAIGVKWADPAGKPRLNAKVISNASSNSSTPSITVSAPSYCALVGGGAYSPSVNMMLQNSYPTTDSNGAKTWSIQGHPAGTGASCVITTYAIGLQVVTSKNAQVPFGPGCQTLA